MARSLAGVNPKGVASLIVWDGHGAPVADAVIEAWPPAKGYEQWREGKERTPCSDPTRTCIL
jgi:hypothetical protein